jgi:hypothetical protein
MIQQTNDKQPASGFSPIRIEAGRNGHLCFTPPDRNFEVEGVKCKI